MPSNTGTQAMSRMHRTRGFTLVELLIATALFAIIMSAIVALFVASMRAVKSAYLASDAYETSRGAFAVVERDLTTVFTMRDFGDYYQFFGTAQGMTMVGLIRDTEGNTTLGRITYVLYPVILQRAPDQFEVTTPFDLPQLNTRPVPMQFVNALNVVDDEDVGTAALIRFVEKGVEDLDSYPPEVTELFTNSNPEIDTSNIKFELDIAISDRNGPQDSTNVGVLIRLNPIQRELLAAKKRELWIRMLSGQEYWMGGPAQDVDLWDLLGRDPRDFVVAENIGLRIPASGNHTAPLRPLFGGPDSQFLRYGRIVSTTHVDDRPTWNFATDVDVTNLLDGIDNDNDGVIDEFDEVNIGNPLTPRLPEVVTLSLPFAYERPYPTAPQFERNLEQVIDVPSAYARSALVGS